MSKLKTLKESRTVVFAKIDELRTATDGREMTSEERSATSISNAGRLSRSMPDRLPVSSPTNIVPRSTAPLSATTCCAVLHASDNLMLQSAWSKVPIRMGKLEKHLHSVCYNDHNTSKLEVAIAVKPVFVRSIDVSADALSGAGLYGELRAHGGDLRRRIGFGVRKVCEYKLHTGIEMTDFNKPLISLLEREIPELADRIQVGAVNAQTLAPFAALSVPR